MILAILSALSYPVLAGASWLIQRIMSWGSNTRWERDAISDFGMIVFVTGLTIAVALAIIYVGLRDWADPDTRSAIRARRTVVVGLIATPFTFALLAITITVINTLLHGGNYP
jgi:hypothetical protein